MSGVLVENNIHYQRMNIKMNGWAIDFITWPDTETDKGQKLKTDKDRKLFLSATYHGDRDEFWVVEEFKGVEVARYNTRFIDMISWITR